MFGLLALAVVMAGLTISIAGTGVVTDPRETFSTLGSAFSGPIGGLIIGILAAVREPDGIVWASLLAHVPGCLWVAWSYRFVWARWPMPRLLVGWAAIVAVYYYGFLVPGFVVGMGLFHIDVYRDVFGAGTSLVAAYGALGRGAVPEALFTMVLTTLIILALPRKHRRPLW